MLHFASFRHRLFCLFQEDLGLFVECLPGGRESNLVVRPFEKSDPDLLFQLFDLVAQRRLRHMHELRGVTKMESFGDRDEVSEMPQFPGSPLARREKTSQIPRIPEIHGMHDLS
jgi:hypothetical protein